MFAGQPNGQYSVYSHDGAPKETIDQGVPSEATGCSFDPSGAKLYTTAFTANQIVAFAASHPHAVTKRIDVAAAGGQHPESIAFARDGSFYVGTAESSTILHYGPDGQLQRSFPVAVENRGTDWIDLAADQHTLFYTSEGGRILRYDTATGQQLADFANVGGVSFSLRLLPESAGGGLVVANTEKIERLDASGAIVQTYDVPGEDSWFAVALDQDGRSFWSGDESTGNVYRFDLATGAVDTGPIATGNRDGTSGLCLAAERTAGTAVATGSKCAIKPEVVVYAPSGALNHLLPALSRNPNPCAQYYITVPPCTNDKTRLVGEGCCPSGEPAPGTPPCTTDTPLKRIHDLGPNFHALAEFAWGAWSKHGGSWAANAAQFRTYMANAGYNGADSWAIQELGTDVRQNTRGARLAARQVVAGLADGAPRLPGAVFVVNPPHVPHRGSHYLRDLQQWTLDRAFWQTMTGRVRWWAQEAYPDCAAICIGQSQPLARREEALNAFLLHHARLAVAGPAGPGRAFLKRRYMSLDGAYWRGCGGYGHSDRIKTSDTMARLIRLQVYAVRRSAAVGGGYPGPRIGFAWNESAATRPCKRTVKRHGKPFVVKYTAPGVPPADADKLATALAGGLKAAYQPGGKAADACKNVAELIAPCAPGQGGGSFEPAWAYWKRVGARWTSPTP